MLTTDAHRQRMHGGAQPPCIGVWLISATNWWLRSPNTNNTTNVWNVNTDGSNNNNNYSNSNGVRPALMDKTGESSLPAKTVSPSSKGAISRRQPLCLMAATNT